MIVSAPDAYAAGRGVAEFAAALRLVAICLIPPIRENSRLAQPFIRNLLDAGVFSLSAWARHPLRTALRMIPLRVKQGLNRISGRPVFDLSFYLQFQPPSLDHLGLTINCKPAPSTSAGKRRVALVTPHLGPGGAENVLLEIARSFDRGCTEIFVIATHSRDCRLTRAWQEVADHVCDLAAEAEPESVPSALLSLIVNRQMNAVIVQNSLFGYAVMPRLKTCLAELKIIDIIHTVGTSWDIARATAAVAAHIDRRIVISESARRHLVALGTNTDRIRLIPNGIDLDRFRPAATRDNGVFRILFAARLDPVKRPLLLIDIARALAAIEPPGSFRFVVAGNGPEERALRLRIQAAGLGALFDLRGFVPDLAPLLAECDVLLLTSSEEGIPLTILEAFACARPAVATRAGAIAEVLDENTGMLIDRPGR